MRMTLNHTSAALALLTVFAVMAPSAAAKPRPKKPAEQPNPRTLQSFSGVTGILGDDGRNLIYITNNEGLWILQYKQEQPTHNRWEEEEPYREAYKDANHPITNNEGLWILRYKQEQPTHNRWEEEEPYREAYKDALHPDGD